ncbi:MAG: DUF2848 domain-containing protein [Pseudorhodobacter sp.]
MRIDVTLVSSERTAPLTLTVDNLVIAGWAGRNREAMEHHIQELEALGIKRPATTPTFYRVAASRLSKDDLLENPGGASSGEVEAVVFAQGGKLYVGIGSDHTDREVEAYGITVSKQLCDKPVGPEVWPFAEVADHWDQIIMRSWTTEAGKRTLYQEGRLGDLLDPRDVIARYTDGGKLADGTALFGGTPPAIGGVRPGERFEAELDDPVLSRKLRLVYDIGELPIAG